MQDILADSSQLGEEGIVAMRRLNRRYAAFAGPTSFPRIANAIIPVSLVDEVLATTEVFSEALNLVGAGGLHVPAYTVPAGKQFTLTHVLRGSSAGNTRLEVVLQGNRIVLSNSDASTLRLMEINPIVMQPGDTVGMLESNNGADTGSSCSGIGRIQDSF